MKMRILLSLIFVCLAALALALTGEKQVRATVEIEAPAPLIWSVLTDGARYSEWNPIFVDVAGDYGEGQTIRCRRKDADGERADVQFTIRDMRESEFLRQEGGAPLVFTYDHRWSLEPYDGGTRVTQHEVFRGLGVWFWNPTYLKTAYVEANTALNAQVMSLQNGQLPQ